MTWVPVRVNLGGDGYTELLSHPNGAAHFGTWIGLVEVAALCDPRGTLIRGNGRPHDAESISRITRIPAGIVREALPRLLSIGWVRYKNPAGEQKSVAVLQDAVASQRKFVATDSTVQTEQDSTDRTEQLCSSDDERCADPLLLESPEPKPIDEVKAWFDSEFWPMYPRKVAKPQALKAACRHGKTATDRAAIMDCLRRRLPALQAQFRTDGDFRPYPASWLNQTPWIDPQETATPAVSVGNRDKVGSAIDEAMGLRKQKG
jgi:hypothetical protein